MSDQHSKPSSGDGGSPSEPQHHHDCVHGGENVDPPAASELHDAVDEARRGSMLSRRSILTGLGLVSAAAAVPAAAAAAAPGPSGQPSGGAADETARGAELVLLGTRAGPPVVADHHGMSTVLRVDGVSYVIDAGRGAVTQFAQAGLRFDSVRAMFLTHLHADHLADYYNFFLLAGHIPTPDGDQLTGPVTVLGPGSAGQLPPTFGGGVAPTVNPVQPVPGTAEMTQFMHAAYAYSSNVFLRDMGIHDIRTLMDVQEIQLPAGVAASAQQTAPSMDPFLIYQDDLVTVHATLVPHGPMFPSFGFRFDTEYGSVTFSGDTKRSENLISMGYGSDILVHEAIGVKGAGLTPAALDHMLQSHVEIDDLGAVARDAHTAHLVVSHYNDLAQHPMDAADWGRRAQKGFEGRVTIGQDLQRIPLGGSAARG